MNFDEESQIWDLDKICLEKCDVKMENIGVSMFFEHLYVRCC